MAEQTSFDDLLSGEKTSPEKPEKPEVEVEKPEVEKPEVERSKSLRVEHRKKEWEAQGRDPETGQFAPKEEPKKEETEPKKEEVKEPAKEKPKQPEMTERERAFLRAAEEERRKRQDIERRLGELEKTKPAEEKKTFWDDPEANLKAMQDRMEQTERKVLMNASEMIARSQHADFDEKIASFAEIVNQPNNQGLVVEWLNSQNPAEFAYSTGKNRLELQQAGSIENLRADIEKKVRAEERAKVEAEFKAKKEALDKERAALTPSLSDVKGAAVQQRAVFTGPTPFEEIIKH